MQTSGGALTINTELKEHQGIGGWSHVMIGDQKFAYHNNYIAKGSSGSVHTAYKINNESKIIDEKPYAIKKISKLKNFNLDEIKNEVTINNKLGRYAELQDNNLVVYLAMDLETGYPLDNDENANKIKAMTLDEKLQTATLLTKAYTDLHEKNVVHADSTPGNILLNVEDSTSPKKITLKIIDFGGSREIKTSPIFLTKLVGTPKYLAPEMKTKMQLGFPNDIYALGIILKEQLFSEIKFEEPEKTYLLKFLNKMQNVNPDLRPTANDATIFFSTLNALHKKELESDKAIIILSELTAIIPLQVSPLEKKASHDEEAELDNSSEEDSDIDECEITVTRKLDGDDNIELSAFLKRPIDQKETPKAIKLDKSSDFDQDRALFKIEDESDNTSSESDEEPETEKIPLLRKELINDIINNFHKITELSTNIYPRLSDTKQIQSSTEKGFQEIANNWKLFHNYLNEIHNAIIKLKKLQKLSKAKPETVELKEVETLKNNDGSLIIVSFDDRLYAINLKNIIGEGGFGKVYEVYPVTFDLTKKTYVKTEGKSFVAKIMDPKLFDPSEADILSLLNLQSEKPKIIKIAEEPKVLIIMENLGQPLSHTNIQNLNERPTPVRLHLLLTIIRNISFLHSLDIIHCDLRGRNLLFRENKDEISGLAIDLGSAQFGRKQRMVSSTSFSLYTTVPKETALHYQRNKSSDFYALIGLFLELLGEENPHIHKEKFKKSLRECKSIKTLQDTIQQITEKYSSGLTPSAEHKMQFKNILEGIEVDFKRLGIWKSIYASHFTNILQLVVDAIPKNYLSTIKGLTQLANTLSVDNLLMTNQWSVPFETKNVATKDPILLTIKPYIDLFFNRMMENDADRRPTDFEMEDFFLSLQNYYEGYKSKQSEMINSNRLNLALMANDFWNLPIGKNNLLSKQSLLKFQKNICPLVQKCSELRTLLPEMKPLSAKQSSPKDEAKLMGKINGAYNKLAGDFADYRHTLRITNSGSKLKISKTLSDSEIYNTSDHIIRKALLILESSNLFLSTQNHPQLKNVLERLVKNEDQLLAKKIIQKKIISEDDLVEMISLKAKENKPFSTPHKLNQNTTSNDGHVKMSFSR